MKQISTKTSKLDSPNKHCVHVLSKHTSERVCICWFTIGTEVGGLGTDVYRCSRRNGVFD